MIFLQLYLGLVRTLLKRLLQSRKKQSSFPDLISESLAIAQSKDCPNFVVSYTLLALHQIYRLSIRKSRIDLYWEWLALSRQKFFTRASRCILIHQVYQKCLPWASRGLNKWPALIIVEKTKTFIRKDDLCHHDDLDKLHNGLSCKTVMQMSFWLCQGTHLFS